MADPILRADARHETYLAQVSLAGIRPIIQDSVSVNATAEGTYTIADIRTHRVVLFHDGSTNTDIRVELNATADNTVMPVVPGAYFVMEVTKGDVVHLYNTTGGAIVVFFMEII